MHLATGHSRVLPPEQAVQVTRPERRELVQFIPAGTRTLADLYQALAEVEGLITTVARHYRFHPYAGLSERGEWALAEIVKHMGCAVPASSALVPGA